jgi:hypothetical protein
MTEERAAQIVALLFLIALCQLLQCMEMAAPMFSRGG